MKKKKKSHFFGNEIGFLNHSDYYYYYLQEF